MVGVGKTRKGSSSEAPEAGEGDRSWSNVVQGVLRGALWTSHRITKVEIEELEFLH